ncbi:FAD-dependent oxidoreductase [Streptomyces sp. CBMA152]|uniref:FAD-dependent oxidoreductase n=1 Tax=Streptomyces sp. CBMA152 TaxID=1896312 RepID=UPI001660A70D|nr:FAD-dependent oxidoreductase [Streptomyces sp. CBMA152]MBD0743161.1 oxidoreductase [Streptomyces sp. CBMA152]
MTSTADDGADPVDLLVVGAGPAGVAAAVMAASLRMRVTLVEAVAVGSKVAAIGALENVPGGWTTGPQLAEALVADVARQRESGRVTLVQGRATAVKGYDDRAEVALADGQLFTAATVVVATGVTTLTPWDVDWVEAAEALHTSPLWRSTPEEVAAREVVVLGADRPLGTWLRAHPHADARFRVLHPAHDTYKTAEVEDDPRVRFDLVERVEIAARRGGGYDITAYAPDGTSHPTITADALLANLGSKPAALPGLVTGPDGYCPPHAQHPRVLVAGDLKGARMQRIAVALGDGGRAALTPYYGSLGTAPGLFRP